jgi:hypothetical protein
MNFRLTLLAAASLFATAAQAVLLPAGTPNPANVTLVEDANGVVSATYNGAAIDRVLLISGASASSRTLGAFVIQDNCDTTTLSVIFNDAVGGLYRAYLCNMKANNIINGTNNLANGAPASLLVIKRDAGGSGQGVQPIYAVQKIAFMNMTGCAAVAGNPTPSVSTPNYTCSGTGNYFSDAGISDTEPAILAAVVNNGSGSLPTLAGSNITVRPIFQQLFGVAVNLKAYRALQATQGLPQDDLPQNRPTLSKGWVASAMAGQLNGGNSRRGWGMVISPTVDPDVHTKQINVCRRTAGSGSQAVTNAFFLNAACTNGALNPVINTTPLAIVGAGTAAQASASAALVEQCLNAVDALAPVAPSTVANAYGVAFLGRDTDPIGTGRNYRFTKLDGTQPEAHPDPTSGLCTGTKNFPGCDDAQQGRYDAVYESTMQWNSLTPGNASKLGMLNQIANAGFNASALKLNTPAVVDGVMAPPSTYAGLYGALPLGSDPQVYASRVTRGGNSCAPLRIVK